MKYTFETASQQPTYLSPKEGTVELPNRADVVYKFTTEDSVKLTIDGWFFTSQGIEDLKELLTALQNQLKKQS